MNLLYTLKWDPGDGGDAPRRYFEALRAAVIGKGLPPIANLYEVALVVPVDALIMPAGAPVVPADALASAGAPDALPSLAILVVNAPPGGETPDAAVPALEAWLAKRLEPAPVGLIPPRERTVRPAQTLKVASELGESTRILANFGTFAGDFDVLAEAKEAEEKAAYAAKVAEAHAAMDAANAAESSRVAAAAAAAESSRLARIRKAKNPLEAVKAARPPIPGSAPAGSRQGWLYPALIVVGVLMIVSGFWQIANAIVVVATRSSGTGGNLRISLEACPLSVLLAGVVFVVIGLLLKRETRARVNPKTKPQA